MQIIFYIMMVAILLIIGTMLQRLFNGPTIFDRMNALGVIGADTILLLVLFGYIDKRPDMYVDIAISYAILGFIGSLIVAKFIGGKKDMIEQFGFTSPREVIAALFLLSGLVFFVGSAIGMLRLPDFYSRIHASGNSETLGCTLSFIGLMIYEGPTLTAAKMAFVFLLVFMANPIGSHILSKAAYKSGHPVWTLQSKGAKKLVGLEKADHSADEPVGHIRKKPAKTNRNQVHKYLKKKGDK